MIDKDMFGGNYWGFVLVILKRWTVMVIIGSWQGFYFNIFSIYNENKYGDLITADDSGDQ